MSEVWYTPNGEEVSTIRARITATGVALLMAYVVNWASHGLATFVLLKNSSKQQKNQSLTKVLETTRVLYLYAVCSKFLSDTVIFSVYPPFFQGLASTLMSWITWAIVLMMHVFCFVDCRLFQRSLWAYSFALYHFTLVVWFLLIMGFAYTWMSWT